MALPPDLAASLPPLATVLTQHARHDWWIIGSAACALHGVDPGGVRDIDVLLDLEDLTAIAAALGLPLGPGVPDERFRSAGFLKWSGNALPVEFMAGFELFEGGRWTPVMLQGREFRGGLSVPPRAELKRLFERFGRPKDLARAALL